MSANVNLAVTPSSSRSAAGPTQAQAYRPESGRPPLHALSVDVEDWYHDGGIVPSGPEEHRVERNVMRLLELFSAHDARATFFVLGEVAIAYPSLVHSIVTAGHEVASHGHRHRPLGAHSWREFQADVSSSLRAIEDASGHAVKGYRAPYFSLRSGVRWPFEILAEAGLLYDSSVLPIDRPPGLDLVCSRAPFRHHNGLWEAPVAILDFLGIWHLPMASGIGLRTLPPKLLMNAIDRFEKSVGAGVFYLHPWELDPESPCGQGRGRWLLRVGRGRLPERLSSLLRVRRFAPIREVFAEIGA